MSEENKALARQFLRMFELGDPSMADEFVGMYVNDWTLDFGPRGRQAVTELLKQGAEAGVIPELVVPEFVE